MNKDEIKKALECCCNPRLSYCSDCPYHDVFRCSDTLSKDALDLIIEQENEIEYRKKQYDNQIAENTRLHIEYDKAFERLKAQQREIDRLKIQLEQANARIVNCSGSELDETNAVKEFAEKLKEKYKALEQHYICMYDWDGHSAVYECEIKIDELLKEYEK